MPSPISGGPRRSQYRPPLRVNTNATNMTPPGYASSTSTLAYSSPPSPVYTPAEYARDVDCYPGALYHTDTGSTMREKMAAQSKSRVDEPILKNKSMMKLLTSITVGIMVCLIVAAVVGKIRASPNPSSTPIATATTTAVAVTFVDEATPTPTSIASITAAATQTTISTASTSTTSAPVASGTSVAKYACPYVQEPRKRTAAAKLCKLVAQTDDQKKDDPAIIDTHTWHMDGCTVARSSYNGRTGEPKQFSCAVTCPGNGKAQTEVDNTFACA